MKTVKEVSNLTGISVRTLHYYDEIGLLKPTKTSEAGYRLYDDKALEVLRQILFFRELDIPLKDIKMIMENPGLDQNQLLKSQKRMLILKKERLERIISSIDDILKGENRMNFEVFSKADIEQMYDAMTANMSDEQKGIFIKNYGSMEAFEKHFKESASGEQAQKNFAKVVEWYGDKESAMAVAANTGKQEGQNQSGILEAYQNRFDKIIKKLAVKMGTNVETFEVKEIIGELDFVTKQFYQMKDAAAFMLDMAHEYRCNKVMQKSQDRIYGEGVTEYLGRAIEAFYRR